MQVEEIRAWLQRETRVPGVAVGTTRGQFLASLVDSSIAYGEGPSNPWHADFAWVAVLRAELAELDPRLLKADSGVSVRSIVRVVLSSSLCEGLSVPTR